MQAIINWLQGIGEAIGSLVTIAGNFFRDLAYLVRLLAEFTLTLPSIFSWMPASIVVVFTMLFSIVVIYKVIGRD